MFWLVFAYLLAAVLLFDVDDWMASWISYTPILALLCSQRISGTNGFLSTPDTP